MIIIKEKELKETLKEYNDWLNSNKDSDRVDLRDANLINADLNADVLINLDFRDV